MTKIIIQIIKEGSLYCEYIVATSWLTSLNLIDFQGRQQQKTSGMAFIFWLLQCLKALLQPSPNCVVLTYIIRLSQQKELIELSLCVVNFFVCAFLCLNTRKTYLNGCSRSRCSSTRLAAYDDVNAPSCIPRY